MFSDRVKWLIKVRVTSCFWTVLRGPKAPKVLEHGHKGYHAKNENSALATATRDSKRLSDAKRFEKIPIALQLSVGFEISGFTKAPRDRPFLDGFACVRKRPKIVAAPSVHETAKLALPPG